jgi:ABC-type glycerol-3-phosphate transport system permease component
MIRKTTWIMLGLFLAVMTFAIVWTRTRPTETEASATQTPAIEAVWSVSLSEIVGVRVEDYARNESIEVHRDGQQGWIMIWPEEGPIDPSSIESEIDWLTNPTPNRILSDEGGLDQFGLIEPKGKITVMLENGLTKELLIGNPAPTGNYFYVIEPGNSQVLLFGNSVVNSLMGVIGMNLVLTPTPEGVEDESSGTIEP